MLADIDNTTSLEQSPSVAFETLLKNYEALLPQYSVRTNNVLQTLMDSFSNKQAFLDCFLKLSRSQIARLRNCGQKTIEEIMSIQSRLNPNQAGCGQDNTIFARTLPSNIDTLLPLILPRLDELTVRGKNSILLFLRENNDSLADLYAAVNAPGFNPAKLKNVGRTTIQEVTGLLHWIMDYLESFSDEQSVEDAVSNYFSKNLDDLHIPAAAQPGILNLEKSLGHFPLFAAIKAYLDGLEGEERIIIDGCFLIHEGQTLQGRDKVAALLGLSIERVRQKLSPMIDNLSEYFSIYRTYGFVDDCPYEYQMRRVNEDINSTEGTDFSLHFVNWVLASTFPDLTLFGDLTKTLTGYYDKTFFVCLVPTDLCKEMDFAAFIQDVEARLAEKRIDAEEVSLDSLIQGHLTAQHCQERMELIKTACRSILLLHFPVEVFDSSVVFRPNTRKNNPLVIEDIIRAAGRPLTLEEIYQEFIALYPERNTDLSRLRGNINNNPNIIPISRTSTYSLAEWDGEVYRGGSIRQIIAEYLGEQNPTIAPFSEVVEYVCRFRPSTGESNILTNLALEQSGMFAFYFKNGVRYLGLAANSYPVDYFPSFGEAKNATAMSLYYPKLLDFIETNGRFPFSSGVDDEEKLLCNFWRRQEHYYQAGELSTSGLEYHTRILTDFGHLRIDKKEYRWKQMHAEVKRWLEAGAPSESDMRVGNEYSKWLGKALNDYKYCKNKLPQWKIEAVEELKNSLLSIEIEDIFGFMR